jgi:hypothetical protein
VQSKDINLKLKILVLALTVLLLAEAHGITQPGPSTVHSRDTKGSSNTCARRAGGKPGGIDP